MTTLMEIQNKVDELSAEEREGLLAYLLNDISFDHSVSDEEVIRREQAMDEGREQTLSHEEFLQQVGKA